MDKAWFQTELPVPLSGFGIRRAVSQVVDKNFHQWLVELTEEVCDTTQLASLSLLHAGD